MSNVSYSSVYEASLKLPEIAALNSTILSVIDLTNLDLNASYQDIEHVCHTAISKKTPAICIYRKFVKEAFSLAKSHSIKIATVANFPEGMFDLCSIIDELEASLLLPVDEIDLVFPYQEFLSGDKKSAFKKIETARDIVPKEKILKIILETGAFENLNALQEVADTLLSIEVDFLKTSTGKAFQGAEPEKSFILLKSIYDHHNTSGRIAGFKASGGVRTLDQAVIYINLARVLFGDDYIQPKTFRIGASQLVEKL